MIDFKKHLGILNIILYIIVFLAIFPVSFFLIGRPRLEGFVSSEIFVLWNYINSVASIIYSIFALFMVYLIIFEKIYISKGRLIEAGEKNWNYYYQIILFLISSLLLIYFFIIKGFI